MNVRKALAGAALAVGLAVTTVGVTAAPAAASACIGYEHQGRYYRALGHAYDRIAREYAAQGDYIAAAAAQDQSDVYFGFALAYYQSWHSECNIQQP